MVYLFDQVVSPDSRCSPRGVLMRSSVASVFRWLGLTALAMLVIAIMPGAASPKATSISPEPYVDTAYNNALWTDVLNGFTSAYPTDWFQAAATDISVSAGTLPPLSSFSGSAVIFGASGVNYNWKINRTSDVVIQNLASTDVDAVRYLPSGTDATGEEWKAVTVPASGKLFSNGPAALADYAGQTIWLLIPFNTGSGSSASIACTFGFGTDYFSNYFFDATLTSSSYRQSTRVNACQLQAANSDYQVGQSIWNHFTASGEHTAEVAVNDNNTDCVLGATSPSGNPIIHDCWIVFKTNGEMEQEFINGPPVPYTNQSPYWTTTLTTPSQSTALAAARSAISSKGCAIAQQYDAQLDATNWGPPSCDLGDEIGTTEPDQTPGTGDDTPATPASPIPESPSGPVASGYSTDLWPGDATNTNDGLNVVSSTDSGTAALTGVVTDDSTGGPTPGATVTLSCSSSCSTDPVATTTDSQGSFAFINMPATSYTLNVSATGYGNYTITNDTYGADTPYEVSVGLTSSAQSYDESSATPAAHSVATAGYPFGALAYSPTRVPPSIRVKMLSTYGRNAGSSFCSTVTPVTQTPAQDQAGPVVNYAFDFYVIHVAWPEVGGTVEPVDRFKFADDQVAWQAIAALISNFGWYHKLSGGGWDIYNASNVSQCFRPEEKVPEPQWNAWLQNVEPTRIVDGSKRLAETHFYGDGVQDSCTDPVYTQHGTHGASQWGLLVHTDPTFGCQVSDWRTLSLYYLPSTFNSTSGFRPPTPKVSTPIVANGDITLTYHSNSYGVNVAWRYLVQQHTANGWRTFGTTKWSPNSKSVVQTITFTAPASCTRYRVIAANPVGQSAPGEVTSSTQGLDAAGECTIS